MQAALKVENIASGDLTDATQAIVHLERQVTDELGLWARRYRLEDAGGRGVLEDHQKLLEPCCGGTK